MRYRTGSLLARWSSGFVNKGPIKMEARRRDSRNLWPSFHNSNVVTPLINFDQLEGDGPIDQQLDIIHWPTCYKKDFRHPSRLWPLTMAIVSAMPMASKRPQRSKLAKVPAAGLRACVHKYLWYQNTVLQQFLTKVRQSPPPPPPPTDFLPFVDQRCTADKNWCSAVL